MLGDRASADHGSSLRCTRLYACRSRTDGQKAITRISPLAFGRARTAPRSGADPLLWRLQRMARNSWPTITTSLAQSWGAAQYPCRVIQIGQKSQLFETC